VAGQKVLTGNVRVFPRDRFGNVFLVDPAVATGFEMSVTGGEFLKPLVGNADGSYTRQLRFAGEEPPVLALKAGGEPVVKGRSLATPTRFVFADAVLDWKPGRDNDGHNKHADPKRVLGAVAEKGRNDFLSLGAFGAVTVGVKGHTVTGGAADDILVVIRPDEQLRAYRVEALAVAKPARWVSLGTSAGVTQTFSLRKAKLKSTSAIRVVDTSGRTRASDLRVTSTPGVSVVGIGFRQTAPIKPPRTAID
jgi:hypothetical protein